MPEDLESRLEQILAELRPGKRNILQDHINELSGKEREDFIREVIKEYEVAKSAALSGNAPAESEVPSPSSDETDEKPESEPESEAGEGSDIESGILNALTVQEASEEDDEEEKPLNQISREPADEIATSFTKAPIHTGRRSKARIPVIIISVLFALFAAFGLSYVFFLSKNPEFMAFTSQLGIPLPSLQSESVTIPVSETTEATTEAVPTPSPTPTPEPTPTPVPTPTSIPTPTPLAVKENAPDLKGIKVVIDPGHQEKTDYKKEPYKKGATTGKARCTSGAVGVSTNQKEYELTLETALMLKDYLEKCGATVVMTRTENDVNISNKERAAIAVKAKPTLFIRLHADSLSNKTVKGVRVYIPKSGKLNKTKDADKLGKLVAAAGKTTFRGSKATNQYTGLNYATSIRSYQIVLGYLSNEEDDKRLADIENRYEMCAAIATFCGSFKKK
ncbi:MAG: N-acetylmuramoyl-L-alanine amidase [Clostridiales bacterium]|nr:N-acetylmuramoyl-L-alanine amidase [Clostridiales bacterium]